MNAPAHGAITLATCLAGIHATDPRPVHALVFTGVGLAWAMGPDRTERIGRLRIFRHRGPTHRWWVWPIVGVAVGVLAHMVVQTNPYSGSIMAGVLVGWGMHLFADKWTKSGDWGEHLPGWLQIRTGTWRERVLVFVPALAMCALLGWLLLPPSTREAVMHPDRVSVERGLLQPPR